MAEPISVIIPTYNRAVFLPEAIASVLAQTYNDFELLVVDDGSTDNTADLLAGYGDRLRYLRQPNRGPAAARNHGIRAARYDLLAFLDSDDRFVPNKLAIQAEAMQTNPSLLISHTEEIWYRNGVHLNQKNIHRKAGGNLFERCLALCVVGMSTVMARRQLFEQVGMFDEDLPCCEDYDLWLRVSPTLEFLYVDHPLTIKNGGRSDQVSSQYRLGMDRFRIQALTKLLEAGQLSPKQYSLAAEALAAKCRIYGNGCLKHGKITEGNGYLELPSRYPPESREGREGESD
jgi:glycosyltransferase involved in cell wall biosynthesis